MIVERIFSQSAAQAAEVTKKSILSTLRSFHIYISLEMLFFHKFLLLLKIILFLIRFVFNIETDQILDKYCHNYPSLKLMPNAVDGLWKLMNGSIVFVGENYFSYINKIHENYFPEVIDGNPKPITEEIKELIPKATTYPKIFFEDSIYALIVSFDLNSIQQVFH
jgi:hypothetical protein